MTALLPKLYKRNSSKTIQEWSIEIDGDKYRTHAGKFQGKIVVTEWTTCFSKNVGRANETTAEEQAESEARSKWKKKTESKYYKDIDKIDKGGFFEPMLAKEYDKKGEHVLKQLWKLVSGNFANKKEENKAYRRFFRVVKEKFGKQIILFSQPKLDGIRCNITKDGMFSRKGKRFVSCPHIFEALKPTFEKYPETVFDGELYNHDLKDDFNEIVSIVKKAKPTAKDIETAAKIVQYHMYDCVTSGRTKLDFHLRFATLTHIAKRLDQSCLKLVETVRLYSEKQADKYYECLLEKGYEGMMFRINAWYENKRTFALLKRKEFIDEEFELLDVLEGTGNRSGMLGKVVCRLNDGTGRTFEANAKGGYKRYKEWFVNKADYIGEMVTIRYQNLTPDGKPRFGRMVAIRDYE